MDSVDGEAGGGEAEDGGSMMASYRTGLWRLPHPLRIPALLLVVALLVANGALAGTEGAPDHPNGTMARQGGPDLEGPTIADVRATPPRARPGRW